MSNATWTQEDQQQLDELLGRYDAHRVRLETPLQFFIRQTWPFRADYTIANGGLLCRWMVGHAKLIRDLLAPFDNRLKAQGEDK